MGNKYSFLISLVFWGISLNIIAQNNNIVPASPESGSLAKSINYPISYNNGLPNITIPLYELKAGELKLPVDISYHAGGFKVNEQYGNVGLGWSLSTDLQISVKINGFSDLDPNGYISNDSILSGFGKAYSPQDPNYDQQHGVFMSNFNTFAHCWKMITNLIDLQPDEYYYKLLNKSGKFYFRPDGSIVTVPYNGIKIELKPITYWNTREFTITDTDGTVYTFGDGGDYESSMAVETGRYSYFPYAPVVTSWKCTSIVSPSKEDRIDFSYKTGETKYLFNISNKIDFYSTESQQYNTFIYGELFHPGDYERYGQYWQGDYGLSSRFPLFRFASPKYICDIGSDAGLNLLDDNGNWVNIPNRNQSNILFTDTKTLKTDIITYSGGKGSVKSLYFNYLGNNQLSYIRIFYDNNYGKDLMINFSQTTEYQSPTSVDPKEKNSTYYLNYVITPENDKYIFNYHNKFIFNNHSTGSDIWGGMNQLTIDGLKRTNSTIKSLPYSIFPTNNYGNITETEIGTDPYEVQVDTNKIYNGVLKSIIFPTKGRSEFEFGPNEYYDTGLGEKKVAGGLRINSIKYYNSPFGQDMVSQKIYKYGENESGNGFIKTKIERSTNGLLEGYYYNQKVRYLEISFSGAVPTFNQIQEEKKTTILPSTMVDMYYSSGSPIYYTEVAEYNETNGILSGKTVYKYVDPRTNYFSNLYLDSTNISLKSNFWDIGHLKSESYFKKSANGFDTIKTKTYNYSPIYSGDIPVIVAFQNNEYKDLQNHNLLGEGFDNSYAQNYISKDDFTLISYALSTGDMLLTEDVEKTKDGVNDIIKRTSYNYDFWVQPNGLFYPPQLLRKETTLSNGKKQAEYFSYPQNYATGNAFIDNLKSNYMLTSQIEKITTVDDKVIEGKLNTYLPDNTGHITKTYELDPTLPLTLSNFHAIQIDQRPVFSQDPSYFEKFSFNYFNNRLAMETPKYKIPTSYYWGSHNTYPVIKAENISYLALNTAVNAALSAVGKSTIEDLETEISNLTTTDQKNLYQSFLNYLRNNALMTNAQFTAYTYLPLIGMTSQTDNKGMTTYYEYGDKLKLNIIRDHNGNILNNYEYHYKP